MNKIIKIALATGLLVGTIATTQACSLSAWDAATGATVGGPKEATVIDRYSGLCGMDGTAGDVLNNFTTATSGPSAEAEMVVRFYFMPTGTGNATIFQTYAENAATTPVYTVTYDSGTGITVTANDAGAGAPFVQAVDGTKAWHSVEIHWTAGGDVDVWVDTDATIDSRDGFTTSGSGASVINAGRLGGITVPATMTELLFDSYESRRTTSIGRLMRGDGSGDGVRGLNDAVFILNEALNSTTTLVAGTPDSNEDGQVLLNDAVISLNWFLTSAP